LTSGVLQDDLRTAVGPTMDPEVGKGGRQHGRAASSWVAVVGSAQASPFISGAGERD